MSKQDDQFYREFGIILGALFVFFLLALFAARAIGGAAIQEQMQSPGEVAKRIEPVGQVQLGEAGQMAEAPAATVEVAAAAPKSCDEVYQANCMACHATGAAGAPKMGDAAAWKPRAALGFNSLLNSAINGKGLMAPRAGFSYLTDEDLANAIRYMLEQTGVTAN